MDLDAYVLAHAHEWQRLEQLVHRGRLDGAESDELVDLYQQVATHLSVVRTGRAAAAAAGVGLLCVNRPGYGTSTPARSTLSSVADDAVAVLDALGLERVGVLGIAGAELHVTPTTHLATLLAGWPDILSTLGAG